MTVPFPPKVAPVFTFTVGDPSEAREPTLLPTRRVPAFTVVAPVNVFVPSTLRRPAVVLTMPLSPPLISATLARVPLRRLRLSMTLVASPIALPFMSRVPP